MPKVITPPPANQTERPIPRSAPALPAQPMPKRHHRLRWTILSVVAVLIILMISGGWLLYRAIAIVNTQKLDGTNHKLSFFQQVTHLVTQKDTPLQGESEDRINILLLGIGGAGHEGPYLTDTMMVASIKPSTHEVVLLSIPRDLVVNIPGYDYRKINNVLSFGRDQKYPGGGEALVVKVVSDLLNIPIQYYARIDFQGFEEAIDALGGITVNVKKSFSDSSYPTENYGYQTVRFKAGEQEMDGATALKYARSRHGNNGEGSDFARAARQQNVIIAMKDKALTLGTLANPKKISDLLSVIGAHNQTNMEVWEMVRLASMASNVSNDAIGNIVLDSSRTGFLKDARGTNNAFILEPVDPTLTDIQFLTQNIFLVNRMKQEGASVIIANASGKTGLADTKGRSIEAFGVDIGSPVTLRDLPVPTSLIVDGSNGKYPATLQFLKEYARLRGVISLNNWEAQTDDTTLRSKMYPTVSNTNSTKSNSNATNTNTSVVPPSIVIVLGQDQTTTATKNTNTSSAL